MRISVSRTHTHAHISRCVVVATPTKKRRNVMLLLRNATPTNIWLLANQLSFFCGSGLCWRSSSMNSPENKREREREREREKVCFERGIPQPKSTPQHNTWPKPAVFVVSVINFPITNLFHYHWETNTIRIPFIPSKKKITEFTQEKSGKKRVFGFLSE